MVQDSKQVAKTVPLEVTLSASAVSKPPRTSGIELLRLLAMLAIVFYHLVGHATTQPPVGTPTSIFLRSFTVFMQPLLCVFIIISGYFLVDSKFKMKKLVRYLVQICLIPFIIALVMFLFHNNYNIEIKDVFMSAVNIQEYWFPFTYLLICAGYPLINYFIRKMRERSFLIVIGVTLIINIIFTITRINITWVFCNAIWALQLYLIGAYLKKYPRKAFEKRLLWFIISTSLLLIVLVIFIFTRYNLNESRFDLIPVLIAVPIFVLFKNFKFHNKYLNILATTVFTVYLVHDNIYLRQWLWGEVFVLELYFNSYHIIWFSLVAALTVYLGGIILGLIYHYTVDLLFQKVLDKRLDKMQQELLVGTVRQ
ncbi:MAG: acyltransferase [Erysipelotrichaceae bacterium]|jgi:hypothetical protein|nr:acyltransferase [Erysipelotrichaceae bacterium]